MKKFIKEVKKYYPEYLKAHKHPGNKALHFFGNTFLIGSTIGLCEFFLTNQVFGSLGWLPLLMILPAHLTCTIYLFAWPGHLWLEKNQPATWFVSRWITKACDIRMVFELLTGRLKWDTRDKK